MLGNFLRLRGGGDLRVGGVRIVSEVCLSVVVVVGWVSNGVYRSNVPVCFAESISGAVGDGIWEEVFVA